MKVNKKIYAAAGVLLAMSIIQFGVPGGRVLPRTHIGNQNIGFQKIDQLQKSISDKTSVIEISIDSKPQQFKASEIGISTDVSATVQRAPTILLKDRLIPFKPLYKLVKKYTIEPEVTKDKPAITAFSKTLSAKLQKEPVNAQAEVKDGVVAISKDQSGTTYSAAKIEQMLLQSELLSNQKLAIATEKLTAQTKEQDLQPLVTEFTKKTSQALTVKYGNTTKVVEPAVLKQWFSVMHDTATNKWSIGLNNAPIDQQLLLWSKEYNVAPGITQVAYYDDVVTSQRNGITGRALSASAIKEQLKTWSEAPTPAPVVLASVNLAPKVVATRTYSRSSAQLQAKLNAWIANHNGRYQVAIRELGGRGREASYNVAQQTVMASTYKPFLAFVAYRQAESGALDLGAQLVGGRNIDQCIEVMIINSDNDCSVALGKYIGWAKVDQIIAAAGFSGIRLNNYNASGGLQGDKLVNANEQAKFLAQLSAGSLNNASNTGKLISYMKRQVYRNGIPAGSRGASVADKVGFLDAYIHDVGIVYGAKSTYALVIMSEGSSWGNIRDLSQAVYDFMNE